MKDRNTALIQDISTKEFIKTSFGNILEWYDFAIYGLFALPMSKAFFPDQGKFIAVLSVFATFAVGFLARPIGSIIFGRIGDKFGKQYAVNLSVWVMAVPTTLIGFLPTYKQFGVVIPLIFVILRICQGLSVGGQFSGLVAIAVESSEYNKSFLSSVVNTISVVGAFLATLIGWLSTMIMHHFGKGSSNELFLSLSWRIPFILSGVLFVIYYLLVPHFEKISTDTKEKIGIKDILTQQPKELLIMSYLSAATMTLYYIIASYLVTYLQTYIHLNSRSSLIIENILLVISIICFPIFGRYADKCPDRIKQSKYFVMLLVIAVSLVFFLPQFLLLGLVGVMLLVVGYCGIISFTTSLFAEMFHKEYRMTACSLSFNLGITFAGFAPMISEIVSKFFDHGFFCFILFVIMLVWHALYLLKNNKSYKDLLIN